jgi:glycosyltransferase involved in cell wall biosynthesis
MISILIPVYNYNVVDIVTELHSQSLDCRVPFEIIILDDYSLEEHKFPNRALESLQYVQYHELPKNIGRSKIRNVLADLAQYPYLLFMDCDAQVQDSQFVSHYVSSLIPDTVLCGGTAYSLEQPDVEKKLRWKYGHVREVRKAYERNENPYVSFTTFNFVVPKHIFQDIRFNEDITNYGHEDTIFGLELKKKNISVLHIDNPLIHVGIDTNRDFVLKTKQGIKSLHSLIEADSIDSDLTEDIRVLGVYKKIESLNLIQPFAFFHKMMHRSIEYRLIYKKPRMFMYDLYKIGYLCSLGKKNKK